MIDWKAWMAVRGANADKALRERALHAERTPRKVIDALVDAGGGAVKRDRGRDRHLILAMSLLGHPLPELLPEALWQLAEIRGAIDALGTVRDVEVACVCDEWRLAGSCDLVLDGHDGRTVVVDFKTGADRRLSAAIQLVAYARARRWSFDTETRGDLIAPAKPRLVVLHAPQDSPDPPRTIDIDPLQAYDWAQLAHRVRLARKEAAA